jgi:hypothetical protein
MLRSAHEAEFLPAGPALNGLSFVACTEDVLELRAEDVKRNFLKRSTGKFSAILPFSAACGN